MKGQIEEQNNNKELAREAYNQGVSHVVTVSLHLSISAQDALSISLLICTFCTLYLLISYHLLSCELSTKKIFFKFFKKNLYKFCCCKISNSLHFSVPSNHTGQFHITIINKISNLLSTKENCLLDSKKYNVFKPCS